MGRKEITASALIALGIFTGCAIGTTILKSDIIAPASVAPSYQSIGRGVANFTPSGGETEVLSFTSNIRLGGWGLDRSWGETPSFAINWNDNTSTGYRFFGANRVEVVQLVSTGRGPSHIATWTTKGNDVIITSPSGAVTVLGQFNNVIIEREDTIARLVAEEKARVARLNNETFDDMVERLTDKVCVRAEGLQYINTRNVTEVANSVIQSFEFSTSNLSRWNAMSPQLRFQRVSSRMNWQCNNVAQLMHQNSLNDSITGLIILDTIFN